ncbi:MAG: hypothetical protein IPK68_21070 [Bdellovibrionales bacterium]|nr:hypothetical protein [Bdellovibrionales bacterium]
MRRLCFEKREKPAGPHPAAIEILDYIEDSDGLVNQGSSSSVLKIFQKADGKSISFPVAEIEEVIPRADADGNPFLQINFNSGKKILLTESLVGFKPAVNPGLDMAKLPSVVTTPDLISVVDAIEESLSSGATQVEELDILRRVFGSVLEGGEAIGFDLSSERIWLTRISHVNSKHSA